MTFSVFGTVQPDPRPEYWDGEIFYLPTCFFFVDVYIFAMSVKNAKKPERPFWSRKNQKAYRLNRVLVYATMILSLLAAGIIWFGVNNALGK